MFNVSEEDGDATNDSELDGNSAEPNVLSEGDESVASLVGQVEDNFRSSGNKKS